MRRYLVFLIALLASPALAQPVTVNPMTKGQLDRLMGWVASGPRTVEVCATCKYTTLNAACAANTSTAASPITFHVHAGLYNGSGSGADTMCSGQDYPTFEGDGIGTTTLVGKDWGFGSGSGNDCSTCTPTNCPCKAALNLGTSTNYTVRNMTLKGNRGIYAKNVGGVGGGSVWLDSIEMITTTANGDEDCWFTTDSQANTALYYTNSRCSTGADGMTFGSGGSANQRIYASGNTCDVSSAADPNVTVSCWNLSSIPDSFYASGEKFFLTKNGANDNLIAYRFVGDNAGATAGIATIAAPIINSSNTTANGNSGLATGILVENDATELTTLNVLAPDITTAVTDTTTGTSIGIWMQNQTTTVINVAGGRIISTGGQVATRSSFAIPGGSGTISAGTFINNTLDTEVTVSQIPALTVGPGAITYTGTDPNIGVSLENSDAGNNEGSPYLKICSSAQSQECRYIQVDSSGVMKILDGSFQPMAIISTSTLEADHGSLRITGAGDDNHVFFQGGTNNGFIKYHETGAGTFPAKSLELNNILSMRLTPTGTKPAKCDIGDWYIDNTGTVGFCVCTVAGTPGTWFDVIAAASPGNCT